MPLPHPSEGRLLDARREVTQHINDVKSRIGFYTGWIAIHGTTEVRAAYDAFVTAAQREAGRR